MKRAATFNTFPPKMDWTLFVHFPNENPHCCTPFEVKNGGTLSTNWMRIPNTKNTIIISQLTVSLTFPSLLSFGILYRNDDIIREEKKRIYTLKSIFCVCLCPKQQKGMIFLMAYRHTFCSTSMTFGNITLSAHFLWWMRIFCTFANLPR